MDGKTIKKNGVLLLILCYNIALLFQDAQLNQYLRDLFVAGTETSASFLRWSLLCFLHFPSTQEKIYQETLKSFGEICFTIFKPGYLYDKTYSENCRNINSKSNSKRKSQQHVLIIL